MYLYYDKNGVLKEMINDNIVAGSSGVNKIYCMWEEDQGNTSEFDVENVWIKYRKSNLTYTELLPSDSVEVSKIPYDNKRDLKYFKYFIDYRFRVFNIPDEVLNTSSGETYNTVLANIQFVGVVDSQYYDKIYTMGQFAFAVNPSTTSVIEDKNITIAQWNELLKTVQTGGGVLEAEGDLIVGNSVGQPARLPIGPNGYTLKSNGNRPVWVLDTDGGGSVNQITIGDDEYTPDLEGNIDLPEYPTLQSLGAATKNNPEFTGTVTMPSGIQSGTLKVDANRRITVDHNDYLGENDTAYDSNRLGGEYPNAYYKKSEEIPADYLRIDDEDYPTSDIFNVVEREGTNYLDAKRATFAFEAEEAANAENATNAVNALYANQAQSADTATDASRVLDKIGNQNITDIFESNGTTVKNATNAENATYAGEAQNADMATDASRVLNKIGNQNITNIFENDGTTAKNATNAENAENATNAENAIVSYQGDDYVMSFTNAFSLDVNDPDHPIGIAKRSKAIYALNNNNAVDTTSIFTWDSNNQIAVANEAEHAKSANSVSNNLKFGSKTFNGSAEKEILLSDLGGASANNPEFTGTVKLPSGNAGFVKQAADGTVSVDTNTYLQSNAQAADSAKLGGTNASDFYTAAEVDEAIAEAQLGGVLRINKLNLTDSEYVESNLCVCGTSGFGSWNPLSYEFALLKGSSATRTALSNNREKLTSFTTRLTMNSRQFYANLTRIGINDYPSGASSADPVYAWSGVVSQSTGTITYLVIQVVLGGATLYARAQMMATVGGSASTDEIKLKEGWLEYLDIIQGGN